MVKGFILCDKGFEKGVADDTQRLLGYEITPEFVERGFFFEARELLDFVTLTYLSQSALRIMIPLVRLNRTEELMSDFEVVSEKVSSELNLDDIHTWFDAQHTFKVEVSDVLKNYDSQKLAQRLGGFVHTQTEIPADMKNPSTKLSLLATEKEILFSIDFSHVLLSKREYKMFNTPTALRGTIAYNLAYESGFVDDVLNAEVELSELTFLDPFCGSGTIPIEAALAVQQLSPRFYETEELGFWKFKPFSSDELKKHVAELQSRNEKIAVPIIGYDIQTKSIDSTKKNAKIAGVNKALKLGRAEIDWIDTKFIEDQEVKYVVTVPPYFAQHHPVEKIQKPFVQFFKRISDLLAEDGVILLVTNKAEHVTPLIPDTLELVEERTIWMGKDAYSLLTIECAEKTDYSKN